MIIIFNLKTNTMPVLNLYSDKNNSSNQIQYTVYQYPDGQQSIRISPHTSKMDLEHPAGILIKSRLNNFKDLELIICATQALKNLGAQKISLYVPYFLGSRSDRKFEDGSIHYLKQVICPIINSQGYDKVTVLDPHSDVLEACLNNYEKINNFELVRYALADIDDKNICLVSPDAGAYKKIFDVAKKFRIENIITATKVRDIQSGKILRTEIPTLNQHDKTHYVIIDDICDGGRTFIELANAMKSSRPSAKISLVVTHGIFSNGFYELSKYFEKIYTTNSVRDFHDVEYGSDSVMINADLFIKQFDVF